jgi:hypothetical protein
MLSIEEGVLFNGTLEMVQGVRDAQREAPLHPVGVAGTQPVVRRVNG